MGTYLSTTRPVRESHPDYPPRTPAGDVFRAILEQDDNDFEQILTTYLDNIRHEDSPESSTMRNDELRNEHNETPLEYLLTLGLTQRRFNILSLLLEKNCCGDALRSAESYKLLTPLLLTKSKYAPVYIVRLLPYIENIPHDLMLETTSEAVHRLFCEYGFSHRIRLLEESSLSFPAEEETA